MPCFSPACRGSGSAPPGAWRKRAPLVRPATATATPPGMPASPSAALESGLIRSKPGRRIGPPTWLLSRSRRSDCWRAPSTKAAGREQSPARKVKEEILKGSAAARGMSRPLLVIDGDSFAHRAFHGLPKTIRHRGDKGGGAIVGFANFLLRLYLGEEPRAVIVGWDTLDAPTYRHEAFAGYQSGRQFDPELVDQLEVLPQLVAACGFANAKAPGYEADDFLAAAVAAEEARGGTAVVATGDRDAFQLASKRTTILQPIRAGEEARIGPAEVRARYGVDPLQVPDFIALRGDSSDRIPGLAGVGPVGAASLLR